MKNLTAITGSASASLCEIIPVISMISLNRLIDGGAAIFALTNRNHHIDIIGSLTKIPLVRLMFRV